MVAMEFIFCILLHVAYKSENNLNKAPLSFI